MSAAIAGSPAPVAGAGAVRSGRQHGLVGALLSAVVSPWFLLLVAFVGVNQWLYVIAGDCPASLILRRAAGLEPGCPR